MITVRPELPEDIAAIRAINEEAFGEPTEASIVDSLRNACPDAVSLVAVEDDRILGHILFSPVVIPGLSCQWDGVPDEAFMVLILDEPAMAGVSGTARYRDEFDQAM
jgi:predicted N-acetyltransferase YhbS